ncbi:hypothetical protein GCM10028784_25240 [Myceligenerans cantabricum]
MSAEYVSDGFMVAVVLAVLGGVWFAWSQRHVRGLWMLLPIVGTVSAVVIAVSGVIDVVGTWGSGSAVDGSVVGLYVVALALQGLITRVITGFLSSRGRTNLVPTTVALSLILHLVVLAELFRASDLYLVALVCLAATLLAWPLAGLVRLMTASGAAPVHATTGILMGTVLLGAAAPALL